jgi:hypothetical protein
MNYDIEILKKFLEIPLGSSDGVFECFANLPNAIFRGEKPERFLYVQGTRRNKVLLVAHADTFWDDWDCDEHQLVLSNNIIWSLSPQYGLGADDRAGCAILWLLKELGHSLLITDGEECGRMGSTWLMSKNRDIADEINNDHQFVIQFDRRGGSDFKCYTVGTDEFREHVSLKTGYTEPDMSIYTDIVTLCETITGVNLSIGYHQNHTFDECLIISEWQNTLDLCRNWLAEEELPRFTLFED